MAVEGAQTRVTGGAMVIVMVIVMTWWWPATAKECTNIPTQLKPRQLRERDYAMMHILRHASGMHHDHHHHDHHHHDHHHHDHHHHDHRHHDREHGNGPHQQQHQHHHTTTHSTGPDDTLDDLDWDHDRAHHGHGIRNHVDDDSVHDDDQYAGRRNDHAADRMGGQHVSDGMGDYEFESLLPLESALVSPWHKGLTTKEKLQLRRLIALSQSQKQQRGRQLQQQQQNSLQQAIPENNFLSEMRLHDVRLLPGSAQHTAQDTNLRYLLMLDADRMLWNFRVTAGVETKGVGPYGGWEKNTSELRGHFVGHYLSASALAWASTGNETLREKMEYMVSELERCQDAMGTGYLSAFPSEFFDRFEAIKPVWAPYYTIHKIMAGLVDQHQLAGSAAALFMAVRMAAYFDARVQSVIRRHTIERHWQSLNEEFGGMNDVLYRLYTITGDVRHLALAHLFDKPCFLGPLALHTDDLSDFHSNTHIPIIVGCQARYEVTGDPVYKEISHYFMRLINISHSFTSGGTSSSEFWNDPYRTGDQLGQEDQESCTTYNMLKVSRNLLRWTADASHADYYEKALVNGVLGIQRGTDPGVMIYMLPHGPGNSKARGYHGWGTPFDSFWCCYGTGIESFAKLGDSIYFHRSPREEVDGEEEEGPTLFIVQYVSSSVVWREGGLKLTQTVQQPIAADPVVRVSIAVEDIGGGGGGGSGRSGGGLSATQISLRVPQWTSSSSGATSSSSSSSDGGGSGGSSISGGGMCRLRVNGVSLNVCDRTRSFLTLKHKWSDGDVVELDLPMNLRTERIQDDRPQYAGLLSIFIGPYLLVGLTQGDNDLPADFDPSNPSKSISPMPPSAKDDLITLVFSAPPVSHLSSSALTSSASSDNPDSSADLPSSHSVPLGTAEGVMVLSASKHTGGAVSLQNLPEEGMDEAALATFRMIPPLEAREGREGTREGGSDAVIEEGESQPHEQAGFLRFLGEEFSLESFAYPGHVLSYDVNTGRLHIDFKEAALQVADPIDGQDMPMETATKTRSSVFRFISTSESDHYGDQSAVNPGASPDIASTPFRLELADLPSTPIQAPQRNSLSQQSFSAGPHAADVSSRSMSGLYIRKGLASYSPLSFVLNGSSRSYLLQPIADLRDESYTSYFNASRAPAA